MGEMSHDPVSIRKRPCLHHHAKNSSPFPRISREEGVSDVQIRLLTQMSPDQLSDSSCLLFTLFHLAVLAEHLLLHVPPKYDP